MNVENIQNKKNKDSLLLDEDNDQVIEYFQLFLKKILINIEFNNLIRNFNLLNLLNTF